MVNTRKTQLTKAAFDKIVKEIEYREKDLRKKIADTLNEMRNQGDLRENDGYSMAVEEQNINEEKIRELKGRIQNAEIVKGNDKSVVSLGDTVTLKNSKVVVYEITSEEDANPSEGKISDISPIGQAIMGKEVGDTVIIETPMGSNEYTIQKIA